MKRAPFFFLTLILFVSSASIFPSKILAQGYEPMALSTVSKCDTSNPGNGFGNLGFKVSRRESFKVENDNFMAYEKLDGYGPVYYLSSNNSRKFLFTLNANLNRMEIIDIQNPAAPISVGTVNISLPNKIHISGQYAYVTSFGNSKLTVVDISNPSAPVKLDSIGVNTAYDVTVSGRYAYVISSNSNRVYVVDVSNPKILKVVSSASVGRNPISVAVSNDHVFTVNYLDGTVTAVNVSNPEAPVVASTISLNVGINSLDFFGHYAYISSRNTNSISVLNTFNPASMSIISTLDVGTETDSVNIDGTQAFFVSAASNKLVTLTISNPTVPGIASTHTLGMDKPSAVFAANSHAYVANFGAIKVVKVSDASLPVNVGGLTVHSPQEVQIEEDPIILEAGESKFKIGYGENRLAVLCTDNFGYSEFVHFKITTNTTKFIVYREDGSRYYRLTKVVDRIQSYYLYKEFALDGETVVKTKKFNI